MDYMNKLLDDVRTQIAPTDETLEAVRSRRDDVLAALTDLDGRLRDYASGSIGHGTANCDTDADCGVVLDRRAHPTLGPDGDDAGPGDMMQHVRNIAREGLKGKYPKLATRLTKRAITLEFAEPLGAGDDAPDPSVDLIVALTRKDAAGLWIPNRDADSWDASHPEQHTKLLTDPPADLRRLRARTIRLAKAWNQQYTDPALASFNIEALALEAITETMSLAEAVNLWFAYSARELKKANTKDPAGVSPPIKLLLDRDAAVARLEIAASHMQRAVDHDDDEDIVMEEMAAVFYKYVQKPQGSSSKAALAAALRKGNLDLNRAGVYAAGAATTQLKTVRSYGDAQNR